MQIHVWGVRGSLAAPLTNAELFTKIETAVQLAVKQGLHDPRQVQELLGQLPWQVSHTAGGNTSCIEVVAGNHSIIFDAGTGMRPCGIDLLRRSAGKPMDVHVLLSHTHWDHICGFPFFIPAYISGTRITFYGVHDGLEDRFRGQQDPCYFPITLDAMAADKKFVQLPEQGHFTIGDIAADTMPLHHPGGSCGYRITCGKKTVVYATDSEYRDFSLPATKPVLEFFSGADLVIFDSQYTFLENVEKENWGHSNMFTGIDIAIEAGVKKLLFTHHDPAYNDEKLWEIFQKAQEYLNVYPEHTELQLELAYEGLTINL